MSKKGYEKLCRSRPIQDGEVIVGRLGVKKIAVTRVNGGLYGFKDHCPHAGGSLSRGKMDGAVVECPRHHWAFDVTDGSCLDNPIYCLRLFDVVDDDGWLWVCEQNPEIW